MSDQGFLKRYGPRALILGGSEGIGASFAEILAAKGLGVTLAARSKGPLEETAAKIRAAHKVDVRTHTLDLTGPDVAKAADEILAGGEYGVVVYNAGATHGVGLFLDQPVEKALSLVRLNCDGPLIFAHRFLTPMRARGRGGFIVLSSMSALAGSGYVAAYSGVKSFEINLAEGLNWELKKHNVDVLCAVAGLTDTPAMARSGMIIDGAAGFTPMQSVDVASGALAALGTGPVWFAPGADAAAAMRAAPREQLIESMSQASAALWGLKA